MLSIMLDLYFVSKRSCSNKKYKSCVDNEASRGRLLDAVCMGLAQGLKPTIPVIADIRLQMKTIHIMM